MMHNNKTLALDKWPHDKALFVTPNKLIGTSFRLLVLTTICVLICVFYVDKPVAFWAHSLSLQDHRIFHWMQCFPEAFSVLLPFIYCGAAYYAYRGKLPQVVNMLFISANVFLVSKVFKEFFKWIFGRYWPDTWTDNNLSLLKDGVYGFEFFERGAAFQSFPSGHATATFAVMTVFWICFPRLRVVWALCCISVCVGLLANYYHFVSDVIAGACLGMLVGLWGLNLVQHSKYSEEDHR